MGALTRAAEHLTIEQVKEKMKDAKDPKQLQRWQIVYTALLQPRKAEEIATCVGVSEDLVHKIISCYNREGSQAIEIKRSGGRYHEYMTKEEEKIFLAPFFEQAAQGILTTTKEIQQAYEERLGRHVYESTIYRLLKRHGWRKILPRSRHPKSDVSTQETFKKNLPNLMQQAQYDRKPEDTRPVLLMIQDEARFGRITRPVRCWVPEDMRPSIPHQIVRQAIYVFAAVAPQSGDLISLILPAANTDMMDLFLQEVSQQFPDSFIVMQVDQASWHRSRRLQIPENVRLVFQPPYSPEVNPVEHIWKDLREKHFANRAFSSLDELQEHLCTVLHYFSFQNDIIRSITYFPHIRLACENAN